MLKLEDFRIKEIESLETITGGQLSPTIGMTAVYVNFLGWVIRQADKFDSCSNCDEVPQA